MGVDIGMAKGERFVTGEGYGAGVGAMVVAMGGSRGGGNREIVKVLWLEGGERDKNIFIVHHNLLVSPIHYHIFTIR